MKFSTAKLRNNLDFSKLLAFIFTIWCFFTLFFYHLTHGRNRNEVFSAGLSAISISVISVIAYKDEDYKIIKKKVTEEKLKEGQKAIEENKEKINNYWHGGTGETLY